MLDNKDIDNAVEKKYSDFSDAVKTELRTKMANHDTSKQYASDYDKIQDMKDLFSQINTTTEE